jgi:hypothetical protein
MRQMLIWLLCLFMSCPTLGAHQNDAQGFTLPGAFQVIQMIENMSWQNSPVRIMMIESVLGIEQLTEILAEKIPAGSVLTKSRSTLQFSWVDQNSSNLLELNAVSSHLVRGMYSSIRLNHAESGVQSDAASCGHGNQWNLLLPEQARPLFRLNDQSRPDTHVELLAYRSRLSPAQLAVHFSRQLKKMGWTILNQYSTSPDQQVWRSIEAISNQQRLHILLHPDPAETGFLITRTSTCK